MQPPAASPKNLVQDVNAFLAEMSPAGSLSEVSGGGNHLPAWATTYQPVQSTTASPSSFTSGGQSPPEVEAGIARIQSPKPRRKGAAAKGKKKGKHLAVKSPPPKQASAAKRPKPNRVRASAANDAESRAAAAGGLKRATRSSSRA